MLKLPEMTAIAAKDANIIHRYEDAELVAVLHANGRVGIYAEDDDMLVQISALTKSDTLTPIELANKMMYPSKAMPQS